MEGRRLAAILAADVAAYTRLVEQDTDGTVRAWTSARDDIVEPAMREFAGTIVKFTGDGFLAEFASVQNAVLCSIDIQTRMRANPLSFRVGLHLGDILDDGKDIHGEGVNIAARIEGIAEAGTVCVSEAIRDQVRNRVDCEFVDLGEHQVKHVSAPIRVYQVAGLGDVMQVANHAHAGDRVTSVLPGLAVLPFDNLSGPEQDYFAEGVAEEIITALGGLRYVRVTARNSSFQYRGGSTDVRTVGRELGVRYVLEGSVRRAGDRVRVTAQLVDAESAEHVWAERYDRSLEDIFAVQDDIAASVAGAVNSGVYQAEYKKASARPIQYSSCYDLAMKAWWHLQFQTEEHIASGMEACEKALEGEIDYPLVYSILAVAHLMNRAGGWGDLQSDETLREAKRWAAMGVAHAPKAPMARHMMGLAHWNLGEHAEAERELELGLELAPNDANVLGSLGVVLSRTDGDGIKRAESLLSRALETSPHDPFVWFWFTGLGYCAFSRRDYHSALAWAEKARANSQGAVTTIPLMVACYGHLGDQPTACALIEEWNARRSPLTVTWARANNQTFRSDSASEHYLDGLRSAGVPEHQDP